MTKSINIIVVVATTRLFFLHLLLKLLEKRKFFDHKSASGKPVSHCSINFNISRFFRVCCKFDKRNKKDLFSSPLHVCVDAASLEISPMEHKNLFESENANFSFRAESEDHNQ